MGALVYIETDYFGGTGTQAAQAWDAGKAVLDPPHLTGGEPRPACHLPGATTTRTTKGNYFDEFDAVGLGRQCDTGDWLPSAR